MTALPSTRATAATSPTRGRYARRTRVAPNDETTEAWTPRVLVVDDDPSVRQSVSKVLKDAGYDVVDAADGKQALESFDPNGIDLVILDIGLPIQSGWEIFERITRVNPILPIVMITGQTDQIHVARAAGVSALLEKPLNAPQLLHTIRELLAEPRESRLKRLCSYGREVKHVTSDSTTIVQPESGGEPGGISQTGIHENVNGSQK